MHLKSVSSSWDQKNVVDTMPAAHILDPHQVCEHFMKLPFQLPLCFLTNIRGIEELKCLMKTKSVPLRNVTEDLLKMREDKNKSEKTKEALIFRIGHYFYRLRWKTRKYIIRIIFIAFSSCRVESLRNVLWIKWNILHGIFVKIGYCKTVSEFFFSCLRWNFEIFESMQLITRTK